MNNRYEAIMLPPDDTNIWEKCIGLFNLFNRDMMDKYIGVTIHAMFYEVFNSDNNNQFDSFEQAFSYLRNIYFSVNYCFNGGKSERMFYEILAQLFDANRSINNNLLLAAIVSVSQSHLTSDQTKTYLTLIRSIGFNDANNVFEKQEK